MAVLSVLMSWTTIAAITVYCCADEVAWMLSSVQTALSYHIGYAKLDWCMFQVLYAVQGAVDGMANLAAAAQQVARSATPLLTALYTAMDEGLGWAQGQSTALAAEKLSGPASELTARFLVASTEAARLSLHTGAAYLHAGKTVLDLVIYAAPRTCPDFAWPWIVAAVGCTKVVFPVLLTLAFVKGFAAWILQAFVGLVG